MRLDVPTEIYWRFGFLKGALGMPDVVKEPVGSVIHMSNGIPRPAFGIDKV